MKSITDTTSEKVILFDGVCNLCSGAVQFVIKYDKKSQFKFASLQSDYGQQKLKEHQLSQESFNSFILLENGKLFTKSTAALRVAKELGFPRSLLYGFIIVPAFIRDGVYSWISKNRYKWFGKKEACWLPTPALKARFYN